ncbi:hypothetical protein HKK80_01280 [Halonotius sp. F2-221B]|uniref:hypothetical protein n=1 Tax=Halonotius sp. F2-221B TaxID=2731620 RepID=UPI00398BA9B4
MTTSKIGGSGSESPYFRLYVVGLILGTLIRIVAFFAPIGIVRRLEETLLPDGTATDGVHQSQ